MLITIDTVLEIAVQHPLPEIWSSELDRDRRVCKYTEPSMDAAGASAIERVGGLEWMGDSIISAHVVRAIYQRCPAKSARLYDVLKVQLVNNNTLGLLGRAYKLQEIVSFESVPPRQHPKLLANCLEASIAAAEFSGNASGVHNWLNGVMGNLLELILPDTLDMLEGRGGFVSGLTGQEIKVPMRVPNKARQVLHNRLKRSGERYTYTWEHSWQATLAIGDKTPIVAPGSTKLEAEQRASAVAIRTYYQDAVATLVRTEEEMGQLA